MGQETVEQLLVTPQYDAKLLTLSHINGVHAGVCRTKRRLGASFYWPGMGKAMTDYVKSCKICQEVGQVHDKQKAPLQQSPQIGTL